jgi:ABC-type glycerol-3-phosphate transport system substrate-binding protein
MGSRREPGGRYSRSPAPRFVWVAVGMGAVLAVCAGGASARPSAKAAALSTPTVTLKFWNAYNNVTETPVLNKIVIPQFEKENPGIKVEDVNLPYNGLLQKFIAASAAGDPPDLMRSDIAWMPELAAQGTLLEVSGQSWFAPLEKAALPGPLSTNMYKGSYYGVPDDTNTQVLYWNKADFTAAGISGPPKTLTQLYQDAEKLTVPSKGQYGLGVDSTDIWNVGPYIWSTGGSFTNRSLSKASGYMNGNATYDALNHLVDLLKAGDIGSDFLGGAGAVGGETGFASGQYAMLYDGPWGVGTYAKAKPKPSYGLAPLPSGAGGSASIVGGEDIAIAAGGKNLADTIKFVQFLSSPFAQIAMAKAGDMSVYKTDAAAEVKAKPFLKVFAQQLLTAHARPVTQAYGTLDSDFSAQLQKVLAGKLTLRDALNTAAKQADSALAGN